MLMKIDHDIMLLISCNGFSLVFKENHGHYSHKTSKTHLIQISSLVFVWILG